MHIREKLQHISVDAGNSRRQISGEIFRLHGKLCPDKFRLQIILPRVDRTGAVNQRSARFHIAYRVSQDLLLERNKRRDLLHGDIVLDIPFLRHNAQSRAGNVAKNHVGAVFERGIKCSRVLDADRHAARKMTAVNAGDIALYLRCFDRSLPVSPAARTASWELSSCTVKMPSAKP